MITIMPRIMNKKIKKWNYFLYKKISILILIIFKNDNFIYDLLIILIMTGLTLNNFINIL